MNTVSKKFRGRPKKQAEAREAERLRMVEAAAALLREGGSDALTARAVAERLGVAVGTVYGSFAHLEEIKLEANVLTMRALREHLLEARGQATARSPTDELLVLAHAYLAFARANRRSWGALFDRTSVEAPKALSAEIAALFAIIEEVLSGIRTLAPEAVPLVAKALWSSVHGMVYLGEFGNLGPVESDDVPAMIDMLIRAAVSGWAVGLDGDRR